MVELKQWFRPLADSTVLVTSAAYGLLIALAMRAGLFGLWLLVLVGLSLWRYAYAVLRGVAQGKTSLPPPGIETMNPVGDWRVILHFLLFFGLVVLSVRLASGIAVLELALVVALALVFPASAAILGLTTDLVAALSPVGISAIVRVLGRDYVALVAACFGVLAIAALTQRLLVPRLGLLSGLVGAAVGVWTLLASFALIGVSIRAHRSDFDIPGERPSLEERDAEARRKEWQAELDLAYASIRGNELERGYDTLSQLIARNGGSAEVQHWLFENMIDWEDRTHAYRVAQRLIARLVEIGDLPAALEVVQRCWRLGGRPAIRPGARRLLARYAREIGQLGLASEIEAEPGDAGAYSESSTKG